jgi:hypothetical protein
MRRGEPPVTHIHYPLPRAFKEEFDREWEAEQKKEGRG